VGASKRRDLCGVFMKRCKSWVRQKKCDSKGLFCGDFFEKEKYYLLLLCYVSKRVVDF
jgi:hypothetical protein